MSSIRLCEARDTEGVLGNLRDGNEEVVALLSQVVQDGGRSGPAEKGRILGCDLICSVHDSWEKRTRTREDEGQELILFG